MSLMIILCLVISASQSKVSYKTFKIDRNQMQRGKNIFTLYNYFLMTFLHNVETVPFLFIFGF